MSATNSARVVLSVVFFAAATGARAQDAAAPRAFEVASVKPNASGDFRKAIGPALNNSLRELVTYAYGVDMARAGLQIAGGPPWMDRDRFDIDARAPGGTATPAEAREMVRTLLADRFKLQARRETRDLPTYDLVVDRQDSRLGSRLRASTIDCEARRAAARRGGPPPTVPPPGPPPNPETIRPVCGLRQNPARLAGDAVSMTQLASALGPPSGRIVFDRTGLAGYFDIDLEWLPDDPAMPPLVTAIREQLGLRLEPSRANVEVVVVVSAERPMEN